MVLKGQDISRVVIKIWGIHRCKLELTKRECESKELSRLVGGRVVFFVSHRLNDVVTWYHLVLSSN